jgi:hypothetical protein
MLFLFLACRSGVIHYPTGSDDLRAAWYQTAPYPLRVDAAGEPTLTQTIVMLANTQVYCADIPTPAEVGDKTFDSPEALAVLTRENARVVILYLFQDKSRDLVSTYVVDEDQPGENVTTQNGVASAAYLGVNEAELVDEDGLVRFYLPGSNPGDCMLIDDVPPPGEVVITDASPHLKGTFSLDAIDVSGRFEAKECTDNPDFMTTLESVSLINSDEFSMCIQGGDDTPVAD